MLDKLFSYELSVDTENILAKTEITIYFDSHTNILFCSTTATVNLEVFFLLRHYK